MFDFNSQNNRPQVKKDSPYKKSCLNYLFIRIDHRLYKNPVTIQFLLIEHFSNQSSDSLSICSVPAGELSVSVSAVIG